MNPKSLALRDRWLEDTVRGVHALWDGLVVGDGDPLRIVDVGAGTAKQKPSAIGVDRHPGPLVDVAADLRHGLPFGEPAPPEQLAQFFD